MVTGSVGTPKLAARAGSIPALTGSAARLQPARARRAGGAHRTGLVHGLRGPHRGERGEPPFRRLTVAGGAGHPLIAIDRAHQLLKIFSTFLTPVFIDRHYISSSTAPLNIRKALNILKASSNHTGNRGSQSTIFIYPLTTCRAKRPFVPRIKSGYRFRHVRLGYELWRFGEPNGIKSRTPVFSRVFSMAARPGR